MKTSLTALILLVILATSCKKEDSTTTREQLTNKNWKVTQSGIDENGNKIPDGNELKPIDSTTRISGSLNENGTGSLNFTLADTTGTANFTWTLDESNTYITSTIPVLNTILVSKLLSVDNNKISVIVDTSAIVKLFAVFEKQ